MRGWLKNTYNMPPKYKPAAFCAPDVFYTMYTLCFVRDLWDSKGSFCLRIFSLLNGFNKCLYNLNPRRSGTALWTKQLPSVTAQNVRYFPTHIYTLSHCHRYQVLEFLTPNAKLQSPLLFSPHFPLTFSLPLETAGCSEETSSHTSPLRLKCAHLL